jgi:hypothetical protein
VILPDDVVKRLGPPLARDHLVTGRHDVQWMDEDRLGKPFSRAKQKDRIVKG